MANYKSGAHEYTFSNESGDNGLEINLHPKLYIQVYIITFFNYGWRGLLLKLGTQSFINISTQTFGFYYHILIGLYNVLASVSKLFHQWYFKIMPKWDLNQFIL